MHTKLSVIMPVYHEGEIINNAISHLVSIMPKSSAEIIVVDGDTQKSTINKICYDGIKKIVGPTGRGPQMNAGAALAEGDILLFLHADTVLPFNATHHILSSCSEKDCA